METSFINLYAASYFVFACMSAGIGCFVFFYDVKKYSNICFLLLTILSGLWIIVSSALIDSYSWFPKEFLSNSLMYFFGECISLMFLCFVFAFTRQNLTLSGRIVSIVLVPFAAVVGILYLFPSLIVGETTSAGFEAGPLLFLYLASIFECVSMGIFLLAKRFVESAGVFKTIIRSTLVIIVCGGMLLAISFFGYYHFAQKELFLLFIYMFLTMTYFLMGLNILEFSRWNLQTYVTESFVLFISLVLIIEIVFAKNISGMFINAFILLFFVFAGYFLIKSVDDEARSKEEIEKLVKDLIHANEELQSLDKQKSEFVKISAVRLKEPLTAIKGYSSMLLEGSFGGKINTEAFSAIEKIYEESEWLVNIIKDFMDITNIESGRMEYVFENTDLKHLVRQVLDSMSVPIKKSGLEVTFDTDRAPKYIACVDTGKVRQVISNLIDNSIKYTPKGSVYIFLKKEKEPNRIHLTITDTGVGIAPGTIDKLFEKFIRADDANRTNTSGSGLGLYVAKEIVKKHGGRIWVESPGLGRGSTFHIEFFEKEEEIEETKNETKK